MTTENKDIQKTETKEIKKTELTHDRPIFTPLTDIYEKDDTIWVVCDMPGVDEKQTEISLENDILTVTGHQADATKEKHDLIHHGYQTGIYQRSFSITNQIDKEKIKATIKKGVLSIELPKAEEAKPKKIVVNG